MIVTGRSNQVSITNQPIDVNVLNSVSISGSTITLPVSGEVTIGNTVTVDGTVNVGNTVNVNQTKTIAVSGDVGITGTPTVNVGNTVDVNQTKTVAVSGNVGVTGSVDVDNTVNVAQTKTVAVSGDVTVDGTVDVGNTVTVTGSVDVDNTVNVAQTKTVAVSAAADSLPVQVTNQPTVGLTDGNSIALVTSAGQPFHWTTCAEGQAHLGTAMIQGITTAVGNVSTANLSAGESFIGSSELMLGASTIQFFASSNVKTRVTVQQGVDENFTSNVIEDYWDVLPNTPFASFVSSVSPYSRLKVTNTDTVASSAFVCAMGLTPVFSVLPRALTDDNRLMVETTIAGRENIERLVFVSPINSMNVNTNTRLVGTNFDGTVKDTNFWTEYVSGSGSVVQDGGEVQLNTGTTANSYASYRSVQRARYVVSRPMRFLGYFALTSVPVSGNVRRIGAYDDDDGFFFQMNGLTFQIGSRRGGVDTLVDNGTLNGNYGLTWNPALDQYYKLEIEYGGQGAVFYVNGTKLHKLPAGHWTNNLTLPASMQCYNFDGQDTDCSFDCLGNVIFGQGEFSTSPTYKYINGAVTNQVLKRGAGLFRRILNNDNAGTITVRDGVDATGTIIAQVSLAKVLGTLEFDVGFNEGLVITTTGAAVATIIYE